MTEKDKIIQEQRQEIAGLKEELDEIVESCALCQFCKYADDTCERWSPACKPVWRGLNAKRVQLRGVQARIYQKTGRKEPKQCEF